MNGYYAMISSETRFDAVVLCNGSFPHHALPLSVLQEAKFLCCCDGACNQLERTGRWPDMIVGDGDSIDRKLCRKYADRLLIVSEQDDNDQTKATRYCMEQGYRKLAYVGATGKREDHTMGNISLLARYQSEMNLQPTMLTDYGWFVAATGKCCLETFPGQQVSIFNISCSKLENRGLRWSSYPYQSLWQGTLNEGTATTAELDGDGSYIVFRTYPE